MEKRLLLYRPVLSIERVELRQQAENDGGLKRDLRVALKSRR